MRVAKNNVYLVQFGFSWLPAPTKVTNGDDLPKAEGPVSIRISNSVDLIPVHDNERIR